MTTRSKVLHTRSPVIRSNHLFPLEMAALSSLQACPTEQLSQKRGHLPSWEQQLIAAQNVLFNQELFTQVPTHAVLEPLICDLFIQLAREAYDQKPPLQYEVFTDRINIPVSVLYAIIQLLTPPFLIAQHELLAISPSRA